MEGQTKETPRVRRGRARELQRIVAARSGHLCQSVRDPRRFVPFPSEWNGGQVRRIGFHQQPVLRHEPEEIVVLPFVEGHDPAERHIPARRKRELGKCMRPGVAMHHSQDSGCSSIPDQRPSVVFRLPAVYDHGQARLVRERDLGGKRCELHLARRIVVVVVEPTLANSDSGAQELAQFRDVALFVEPGGVMGMNAGRSEYISRIPGSARSRESGYLERLSNADDSRGASAAGAGDYRVAVAVERRVREVGVAVDEVCRAPVWRGHFRSIQRSTGAAT